MKWANITILFAGLLSTSNLWGANATPQTKLSDPQSAALSFIAALAADDANKARQASIDNEPTRQTIDAYVTFSAACRKYDDAVIAKWGPDTLQFWAHGIPFHETAERFKRAVVTINGDSAVVAGTRTDALFQIGSMMVRKTDGQWRVDLSGMVETKALAASLARALTPMGKAIEETTAGIKAGKFKTAAEAAQAREEAVKDALKEAIWSAMDAARRQATPPASPPSRPGHPLDPQQQALARIEALGGQVEIDDSVPGKQGLKIKLNYARVTDADLELLKGLSGIQELHLNETKVTDAGLKHLAGLATLQTLHINWNRITDAGVEHLKGLTNLKELGLTGTRITDASLEHIKALTRLQILSLSNNKAVTDVGLQHLKGLTGLREIYLGSTQITDTGLEHLKGLRNLERLELGHTNVTDAGLQHLEALTQLKQLWLGNTKVTPARARKLKQVLPELDIPSGGI